MSKKGFFDKLESTETNAALKEQQISEPKKAQPAVKPKHLNAMPIVFFNAHKKGKNGGHTSLDFSQYIYEAVREKLQRDGLL